MDIFTDNERQIQNAFFEIMTNPLYEKSGSRFYRVLIYAYTFGVIYTDDINMIFQDHTDEDIDFEAARNKNRAYLNYYCKKGWMKRQKQDYYALEKKGIDKLVYFLVESGCLDEKTKAYYGLNANKCSSLLSHSCKVGRMLLSFVQNGYFEFLLEIPFDKNGKRLSRISASDKRLGMLIPDGYMVDGQNGERIYLEADSCSERMNSRLIPKFQRYLTTVLVEGITRQPSTIHFSIWSDRATQHDVFKERQLIKDIEGLYSFIKKDVEVDVSFQQFYSSLLSYNGGNEYIKNISQKLNKMDFCNNANFYESNLLCSKENDKNIYPKEFVSRTKRILESVKKIPFLEKLLYDGLRIVCMPMNETRHLIPNVYLEHYNLCNKIEKIACVEFPNNKVISYKKLHLISNADTEESIAFRNVYKIKTREIIAYISIENIIYDIGAFMRVMRFIKVSDFDRNNDLFFLCIIARVEDIDRIRNECKIRNCRRKFFYISNEDFSKGRPMIKIT